MINVNDIYLDKNNKKLLISEKIILLKIYITKSNKLNKNFGTSYYNLDWG